MNKYTVTAAAVMLALVALAFSPPAALVRLLDKTDVAARFGKSSFAAMLDSLPSEAVDGGAEQGWTLRAPDGGAELLLGHPDADDNAYAAAIRFPAAPFIAAGADPDLLPEGLVDADGFITVGITDPGRAAVATPAAALDRVVARHRPSLGYHTQLDHFGIELGGGHMFEWARDPLANDKDMVFVVDPAVFLAAGIDASRVAGWVYGTVVVDDEYGRQVQVDKFLKPFDLQ